MNNWLATIRRFINRLVGKEKPISDNSELVELLKKGIDNPNTKRVKIFDDHP